MMIKLTITIINSLPGYLFAASPHVISSTSSRRLYRQRLKPSAACRPVSLLDTASFYMTPERRSNWSCLSKPFWDF